MAWSESEEGCSKHPNQTPQPGVCPSCLRERLSRIAGNNSSRIKNSFSSSSFSASPVYYYYYSSAASSGGSSPRRRRRHQRVGSDIMDSIYLAISGNINIKGLTKSRSMAYAPRSGARDHNHGVNRKKKGGFWNKLLLRGKKAVL